MKLKLNKLSLICLASTLVAGSSAMAAVLDPASLWIPKELSINLAHDVNINAPLLTLQIPDGIRTACSLSSSQLLLQRETNAVTIRYQGAATRYDGSMDSTGRRREQLICTSWTDSTAPVVTNTTVTIYRVLEDCSIAGNVELAMQDKLHPCSRVSSDQAFDFLTRTMKVKRLSVGSGMYDAEFVVVDDPTGAGRTLFSLRQATLTP